MSRIYQSIQRTNARTQLSTLDDTVSPRTKRSSSTLKSNIIPQKGFQQIHLPSINKPSTRNDESLI